MLTSSLKIFVKEIKSSMFALDSATFWLFRSYTHHFSPFFNTILLVLFSYPMPQEHSLAFPLSFFFLFEGMSFKFKISNFAKEWPSDSKKKYLS